MITDTLALKTTGTAGVIALADALERAGRAQAGLGPAAPNLAGAKKLGEIEARRVAELSKIREKGALREREVLLKSDASIALARQRSAGQLHAIDAKGNSQFQLNRQKAISDIALERVRQDRLGSASTLRSKVRELRVEKQRVVVAGKAAPGGRRGGLGGGKGGVLAGAMGGKSNAGVTAIGMGIKAGAAIGLAGAAAAAEFGQAVIQAQAFREDVFEAFKIVTKSESAALSLMQRANSTADKIGMERASIAKSFLDLTTKGFTETETDRIVRSLGDIATIDPNASIEGLTKVIGKVKATGRLNQEVLNELSTFGLEQSDVIKEIGRMTGKNDSAVLKALSTAGGIRDLGVEPILRAINAQVGGGKEGDQAIAKARRNMSSLIQQVKDIPSNLLFDLDVGEGTDRVKGALREVIDFFDASSDTGKETRRVLGDTFNALTEGFFGIDTSGGVTETLKSFVQLIADNRENIKTFAGDVRSVIGAFASAVPVIASVASAIYNVFIGLPLDIIGGLAYLPTGLYELGASAIESLANGLLSAKAWVSDAMHTITGGLIGTAKADLQQHSPSRVMMEIGRYSSIGFAQGLASNDNAIQRAASAMTSGAVAGVAGTSLPASGGGLLAAGAGAAISGSTGATTIIVNVSIAGMPGADAGDLQAVERAAERGARAGLESGLASLLRRRAA
jgi:hypothetical protein